METEFKIPVSTNLLIFKNIFFGKHHPIYCLIKKLYLNK